MKNFLNYLMVHETDVFETWIVIIVVGTIATLAVSFPIWMGLLALVGLVSYFFLWLLLAKPVVRYFTWRRNGKN